MPRPKGRPSRSLAAGAIAAASGHLTQAVFAGTTLAAADTLTTRLLALQGLPAPAPLSRFRIAQLGGLAAFSSSAARSALSSVLQRLAPLPLAATSSRCRGPALDPTAWRLVTRHRFGDSVAPQVAATLVLAAFLVSLLSTLGRDWNAARLGAEDALFVVSLLGAALGICCALCAALVVSSGENEVKLLGSAYNLLEGTMREFAQSMAMLICDEAARKELRRESGAQVAATAAARAFTALRNNAVGLAGKKALELLLRALDAHDTADKLTGGAAEASPGADPDELDDAFAGYTVASAQWSLFAAAWDFLMSHAAARFLPPEQRASPRLLLSAAQRGSKALFLKATAAQLV